MNNSNTPRKVSSEKTCQRILDVAEQLFAERGLDAVSIRNITNKAQVNLAAINYHFGSKQSLITEVFNRRLLPLMQKRMTALDQLESKSPDSPPTLEEILTAFIRPAVEQALDSKDGNATFRKLMTRCLMEPNADLDQMLQEHFAPLVIRFDKALAKTLPHLKPIDLFWRMDLTIGALHHSLMLHNREFPNRPKLSMDIDCYVTRLVTFCAAGFRATPTEEISESTEAI